MYNWTDGTTYSSTTKKNGYLAHHGIKGQKWGARRFQNPDGTLTNEGRARYGLKGEKALKTAGKAGAISGIGAVIGRARAAAIGAEAIKNYAFGDIAVLNLTGTTIGADIVASYAKAGMLLGAIPGGAVAIGAAAVAAYAGYKLISDERKKREMLKTEGRINAAKFLDSGKTVKPYNKMSSEEKAALVNAAKKTNSYPNDYLETVNDWNIPKSDKAKLFEKYIENPKEFYENRTKYLSEYEHL